jgi:hypothetical protein
MFRKTTAKASPTITTPGSSLFQRSFLHSAVIFSLIVFASALGWLLLASFFINDAFVLLKNLKINLWTFGGLGKVAAFLSFLLALYYGKLIFDNFSHPLAALLSQARLEWWKKTDNAKIAEILLYLFTLLFLVAFLHHHRM